MTLKSEKYSVCVSDIDLRKALDHFEGISDQDGSTAGGIVSVVMDRAEVCALVGIGPCLREKRHKLLIGDEIAKQGEHEMQRYR